MLQVYLLLGVAALCGVQGKVDYTGHEVWRVQPQTILQVKNLHRLLETGPYDFWQEDFSLDQAADIRVAPDQQDELRSWLERRGLEHTVMIQELQSLLDKESAYQDSLPALSNMVDLDTSRYYLLSEIYDYMAAVDDENDDVETFETGESYEGRTIQGLTITRPGSDRRAVWVDCGIHAREWISPAICQYIIDQLVNSEEAEVVEVRDAFDWYIYPVVNVDGYEYTQTDRMWRKTRKPNEGSECAGTDANRNFRVGWSGTGSSDLPCSQTYRGEEALSEVETANQISYVSAQGGIFDLGVTIHSYGQFMVYPWGYTRDFDPENIEDLETVCQAGVEAIIGTNGISFNGRRSNGDMAGNTIDSLMEEGGMDFTYLFEVRDTGEYGFLLPPEQILPTDQEIWAGVRRMVLEINDLRNRK